MTNPLSTAPADMPVFVTLTAVALALLVFPLLFCIIAGRMRGAQVPNPPYFAYFCAFGSLGALSLAIACGNSPTSVAGAFVAFFVSPLFLIRNFTSLRAQPEVSGFHRAAAWLSLFSLAVILLLLVWTVVDQYTKPPHRGF